MHAHIPVYIFMLGMVVVGALANAAFDYWLHTLPRPWPMRAHLAVGARWALMCTIPAFAWGIDSYRIPYWEPGVELLLLVGVLVVGLLTWAAHRKDKRRG